MISSVPSVIVLGAGAYGTALAVVLARKHYNVVLWGHNPLHIKKMKQDRCNRSYLPNILFPPSLTVEDTLSAGLLSNCKDVFVAVPSYVFTTVMIYLKLYLRCNNRIIIATKGLEKDTGRFLSDVVRDILGAHIPCAVISGPTFAHELAAGLPTAITLVASDSSFSADLTQLLHSNKNFRVYCHSDFIGVQLSGVVKNIIAIASGISDGIGFGASARTVLITRGLAEMSRLGESMGVQSDVFMSMSGLGDLVLTCTDDQSRNRKFGLLLGKGLSIFEAKKRINQVIEGVRNVKEVHLLSIKYSVYMPITEQVYYILYHHKSVYDAAVSLLDRS
ncbi:NAD(P)H-dependent glycerol-3-phosphate dehydrogenase [Blochmannia endosymbiont of Polyrhachis (Hedomyrma) turneri]|uniref:NAD(P)H-dependent glycerol-3-phosphate dehydrogenase n=1 Tax=Blochmannia endosymbiont of Polyrhachis (Hedomyrma) turneri TaxID=1505596 RepID=UPI00061A7009|nr:NAD(P)H-dependent glycerol-3-phosphate dehydrogenase [Blochmannia endosymbiont of Polyrhachis (Hedomyrma) turneri]AKC60156.1 glycerol-3-phosphate dehydrogenase [NAD(P)+] [Blochmannia endosymbiont of Polyrhachis (Hedomyrma) turneri]